MTKDNVILAITAIVVVALGVFLGGLFLPKNAPKLGDFGYQVYYSSPTMATTSVGIYTPVALMPASGSVTYRAVCNTSPTSTNDLILQFDATSTVTGLSAPGMLVAGNSCLEFKSSNIFTGALYGIFTTNTATVETILK